MSPRIELSPDQAKMLADICQQEGIPVPDFDSFISDFDPKAEELEAQAAEDDLDVLEHPFRTRGTI